MCARHPGRCRSLCGNSTGNGDDVSSQHLQGHYLPFTPMCLKTPWDRMRSTGLCCGETAPLSLVTEVFNCVQVADCSSRGLEFSSLHTWEGWHTACGSSSGSSKPSSGLCRILHARGKHKHTGSHTYVINK